MRVLVTGATGYIGGRLVPLLLASGHAVRCMTRDPDRPVIDPWRTAVEVIEADALIPATLAAALDGRDVAYYLLHSMHGRDAFSDQDGAAAKNFAAAAGSAAR